MIQVHGQGEGSYTILYSMYIIVLNVVKFDATTTTGCDDVDFRIYARFTKFLCVKKNVAPCTENKKVIPKSLNSMLHFFFQSSHHCTYLVISITSYVQLKIYCSRNRNFEPLKKIYFGQGPFSGQDTQSS